MTVHRLLQLTRPLQLAFLALLVVCTAQLAYWLVDEVRYTRDVQARLASAYEAEAEAAQVMLNAGVRPADVARMHPALIIGPDSASVAVSPRVLDDLASRRFHRLNRYAWEGAFFLVVLLAAMAVVYQTLREEAELRRRQEEFLAAVSHELKSPLASLRLSIETLALRDPPAERRAELVHRLLADLGRLQRMIGNILDTSRLAAASPRVARERVVLADETAAMLEEVREHAAESGSRIHLDVPGELVILADPDGVRTALRNLLHNAIRATEGGGDVYVHGTRAEARVRLEVRDTGAGFEPAHAGHLFEKFSSFRRDGAAGTGGTGLGLYLVWRCVRLDHGTVAAASPGPGKGASFVVTWPAAGEIAE